MKNYSYSEEANDIIGKLPKWFIRRGMGVIFIIFSGLLVGSYFIKYPQIVSVPITLTSDHPPVEIVVNTKNNIDSIFIQDNTIVKDGVILALLHNTGDFESICEIEKTLLKLNDQNIEKVFDKLIEKEFFIDDMQNEYSEYIRISMEYMYFLQANSFTKKQTILIDILHKLKESYDKRFENNRLILDEINLRKNILMQDSLKFINNEITEIQFRHAKLAFVQKNIHYLNDNCSLTDIEINILNIKKQMVELKLQHDKAVVAYKLELNKRRLLLLAQIKKWKDNYLITSPITGRIIFTKFFCKNKNIQIGEIIARVIPEGNSTTIGKMYIPSSQIRKISIGQEVNIKLSSYPYTEYGIFKGNIIKISSIPENEGYLAEILISNNNKSSYNKELIVVYQTDGVGEIITDNKRLIERFLQPITVLLKKFKN